MINEPINHFSDLDLSDIELPIIVVYEKPLDFPQHFVARLFDTDKPTNCYTLADTIEDIRKTIPPYYTKIMPNEHDDPNIKEIYV